MSTEHQREPVRHEEALAWAETHFPFTEKLDISHKPWGSTYKLRGAGASAVLKVLPAPLKHAARTTPRISQRFSRQVPEAIAGDEQRGYLLLKDHQGQDLYKPGLDERLQLVRTYAEIQARAATDAELLSDHPRLELDRIVARLLEFLRPNSALDGIQHGLVAAEYFIGPDEARRYHALFEQRSDLLTALVASAQELPDTLNHLDLRPSNAALRRDGGCVIYDWDESLVGPAGMSLRNVFHGARLPMAILLGERDYYNPDEERAAIRLLADYVDTLISGGYASHEQLRKRLGGSMAAGIMHNVSSLASYPTASDSYRSTLADNIRAALSELLDVCDFLAVCGNDSRLFDFVDEYRDDGRIHRAHEIITHYLHRHPLDPKALQEQGRNYLQEGRFRRAADALSNALQVTPDSPALHTELAYAHIARGDFDSALYHLRRSLQLAPNTEETQGLLAHATSLHQMRQRASWPGTVPAVDFTDRERTSQMMSVGKLQLCAEMFQKYGVLQLNNAFDTEVLGRCHAAFLEKYERYLKHQRHSDALTIGDKRYQVTIDLAPPFDHESMFANPLVLPLLAELLGQDCILGAYTSSMSLPGAEDQATHKDHKALFPENDELKNLPSFAISVMIPLINVDERVGTTRVKKGSHRLTSRESEDLPTQSPLVDVGSCYLMDYRLTHHGQANQSNGPRPIINILYQRSWFKDLTNFHRQPPVRLSRARYEAMPPAQQQLLRWTQYPSPIVE